MPQQGEPLAEIGLPPADEESTTAGAPSQVEPTTYARQAIDVVQSAWYTAVRYLADLYA
jgi:hypothetical protein